MGRIRKNWKGKKTMKFYSPLRYPGGKNKLAKFIALVCEKNDVNGHYVEPYAGGASVALHLLLNKHVKEITINDQDRSVYAFWHSVLNRTDEFCARIEQTNVTVANWKKLRKIQNNKNKASLFDLGFSTFFLNRTNHSGIIMGGIIGGINQKGEYKIDCRFNKKELINRIKHIKQHRNKIHLHNLDALDLVRKLQQKSKSKKMVFYFDPPYYLKGPSLYMDHYTKNNHQKVVDEIRKIQNARWIVSYDNTPEIKRMFRGCKKKEYSFLHTAHHIREGKEVLFFSNNLMVPLIAHPTKI